MPPRYCFCLGSNRSRPLYDRAGERRDFVHSSARQCGVPRSSRLDARRSAVCANERPGELLGFGERLAASANVAALPDDREGILGHPASDGAGRAMEAVRREAFSATVRGGDCGHARSLSQPAGKSPFREVSVS